MDGVQDLGEWWRGEMALRLGRNWRFYLLPTLTLSLNYQPHPRIPDAFQSISQRKSIALVCDRNRLGCWMSSNFYDFIVLCSACLMNSWLSSCGRAASSLLLAIYSGSDKHSGTVLVCHGCSKCRWRMKSENKKKRKKKENIREGACRLWRCIWKKKVLFLWSHEANICWVMCAVGNERFYGKWGKVCTQKEGQRRRTPRTHALPNCRLQILHVVPL